MVALRSEDDVCSSGRLALDLDDLREIADAELEVDAQLLVHVRGARSAIVTFRKPASSAETL